LAKKELNAKYEIKQVNKSMVKALQGQVELRKEKLESVKVGFDNLNIKTIRVEENVATKIVDKLRLKKYNKSLLDNSLKAIYTLK